MGEWALPSGGQGDLKHCTVESNQLKAPHNVVGLNVYTPPSYDSSSQIYPVIYLLHGLNGQEFNYFSYFDYSTFFSSDSGSLPSLIDNGLADEAILVFVNGGAQSFYNDWSDSTSYGPSSDFPILSESVIMQDVIPFVDANFRTIASRNGRAIEGFSMGGRGAIKLAFNFPDQFCSTIAYAGAGYESIAGSAVGNPYIGPHEPSNQISTITANNAASILANGLKIRLVDGANDGAAGQGGGSDDLSVQLTNLGIDHEFVPSQSGVSNHNWAQYHLATGAYGLDFHFQCFNSNVLNRPISTAVPMEIEKTEAIEQPLDRTPLATRPTRTRTLPVATSTSTLIPTSTSTLLPTSTSTLLPTSTSTLLPTSTSTPLPTSTFLPTSTPTLIPTSTSTFLPTSTSTFLPTSTSTFLPTSTSTPLPTSTFLPTSTPTFLPTSTSTFLPTSTSTFLPTSTSTFLPTSTSTLLPTSTSTLLPTSTSTFLPTSTPLPTSTSTPLPTSTSTLLPTSTSTLIPTSTFLPTSTSTPQQTPVVNGSCN